MTPARAPHGIARCTRYRRQANILVCVATPVTALATRPVRQIAGRLAVDPWGCRSLASFFSAAVDSAGLVCRRRMGGLVGDACRRS